MSEQEDSIIITDFAQRRHWLISDGVPMILPSRKMHTYEIHTHSYVRHIDVPCTSSNCLGNIKYSTVVLKFKITFCFILLYFFGTADGNIV